jgi:hydroxypyruvate isomerase
MPRFAANLSMMFNEVPLPDRFGAAPIVGFRAMEYLFAYDYQLEQIARRLRNCGLENFLFNASPGTAGLGWLEASRGASEQVLR